MVDLFKQRMEVSKEVAAYKQANGLPTLDAGRERALLSKVGEQAGEELADYTQSVYRTILAAGRSYQNACSGVTSKVYETIRKALDTTPDLFPAGYRGLPGRGGRLLPDCLRQHLQGSDHPLLQYL